MQFAVLCQTFDGGHRMAMEPLRGKAAMDRLATDTSAAITGVASLFHSKPSQLVEELRKH